MESKTTYARVIDCRSCCNYNNMRGRCHASVQCVDADMFISKPVIQLWDKNDKDKK